ncbi:MAG: Rieske 2Fe-2S domain-containing protein [Rhodospirillales bacterium]|nr:Rieske 2Fe-2S domain-containing protein [Rhodospirillales bacterium]MDP6804804.1 Rieske 2Fe-2S domain-containing protein [Rhodospirillales bacterium]
MNEAGDVRWTTLPAARALCRLDDIEDGGSAALEAEIAGQCESLIAVRRGRRVFLYRNTCPHQELPLDFTPGQFLDAERTHILCSNHGALFRIEDGVCVWGPCLDARLRPIKTRVEGETVIVVE